MQRYTVQCNAGCITNAKKHSRLVVDNTLGGVDLTQASAHHLHAHYCCSPSLTYHYYCTLITAMQSAAAQQHICLQDQR
jgi:hypothetical protein